MRYYLRIPVIVSGGASCKKIRGVSCNSMFPCFSLMRGTNGVQLWSFSFASHQKGKVNYFLVFSGTFIRERITELFSKDITFGESCINSSESRIKSATIFE